MNKDAPALPVTTNTDSSGFSKREEMALRIMTTFCSNSGLVSPIREDTYQHMERLTERAVKTADLLIEQLNK